MSERYGVPAPRDTAVDRSGRLGASTRRSTKPAELKDTAVEQAKACRRDREGRGIRRPQEAKYQAKDLYAQTQRELKDQAQTQQQRVAAGLRSVSDELDSLAANAQNPGLAVDLAVQVSDAALGCRVVAGRS